MAYQCDRCGKRPMIGRNISHKKGVAGGRWKKRAQKTRKISLPNLQPFKGALNGKKGKWRLCTKCLKTVKKQIREKEKAEKRIEKSSQKIVKKPSQKTKVSKKARVKKTESSPKKESTSEAA